MKKGFTLVEIIISIALIVLVGTIGTVSVININKNEKNINNITKKILEAANVYVNVETDNKGNTYAHEVMSGAKGVQIPISNLVNTGYIEETDAEIIYNYGTKNGMTLSNEQDYFVIFLTGGETTDYCEDGSTVTLASWMDKGSTIYLCNNYKKEPETIVNNDIIDTNSKMSMALNLKFSQSVAPISEEKYADIEKNNPDLIEYFTKDENGLFSYYNEDVGYVYSFYRGVVNNNYIKLGTIDGKPILWRIVWYRDDGRMKLALDDTIPVTLTTSSGEEITIEPGTKVYEYDNGDEWRFIGDKIAEEYDDVYSYYTYKIKYSFSTLPDAYDNSIYDANINFWYNKTDLASYDYVLSESNFCKNDKYEWNSASTKKTYEPSDNFDCYTTGGKYKTISSYYSAPVGYLTYGDAFMAGLVSTNKISNTHDEHYLTNENSYILLDYDYEKEFRYDSESNESYEKNKINNRNSRYLVSKNGITTGILYKESREDCSEPRDYYTLLNEDGEVVLNNVQNNCKDMVITTSTFQGALKPAIMLNITNKTLSDSAGTKEDPFTIIDINS